MPKNILIITAIAIALIALGATTTYITLRQAPNQEGTGQGGGEVRQEQPVVTLPEAPEEPTTTEPIDTSDWKTYRNEEYGFELKYPGDWIINERQALSTQSFRWETYGEGGVVKKIKDYDAEFYFYLQENLFKEPVAEWAKSSKAPYPCKNTGNIILLGMPAIKCETMSVAEWGYPFNVTQVFIPQGDSILVFILKTRYRLSVAYQRYYLEIFDKILRTFQWEGITL